MYNKNYIHASFMQINKAEDAQALQQVCLQAVDTTIGAGYTLPVTSVQLGDRDHLIQTLRLHYVLLRSKAVLDQLITGLSCLGVLDSIRENPGLFEPYFIADEQAKLTSCKCI